MCPNWLVVYDKSENAAELGHSLLSCVIGFLLELYLKWKQQNDGLEAGGGQGSVGMTKLGL